MKVSAMVSVIPLGGGMSLSKYVAACERTLAEAGLDQSAEAGAPELATPIRSSAAGTASWYLDYAQSSINGFWGDYLARKNRTL